MTNLLQKNTSTIGLPNSLFFLLVIIAIVALLEFTHFTFVDLFISLLAFVPTKWGLILIAQVFGPFLQHTPVEMAIIFLAQPYDILFSVIAMAFVALLSWIPRFSQSKFPSWCEFRNGRINHFEAQ